MTEGTEPRKAGQMADCMNKCGNPAQHGLRMQNDKTGENVVFAVCRSCAVSLKRVFADWTERDGIKLGLAKVDEANA